MKFTGLLALAWAAATVDASVCKPSPVSPSSTSSAAPSKPTQPCNSNVAAIDSDIAANVNGNWNIVTQPAGHAVISTCANSASNNCITYTSVFDSANPAPFQYGFTYQATTEAQQQYAWTFQLAGDARTQPFTCTASDAVGNGGPLASQSYDLTNIYTFALKTITLPFTAVSTKTTIVCVGLNLADNIHTTMTIFSLTKLC
ncbi:hypothetical protein SBRCBS47491_004881 [Sporothrix bragantina]|uniref:Uncharacterized protein n=1 Tax=Sporothrix bragantina TaxID=671064 RepID=A0ABP0BS33_9PEZI